MSKNLILFLLISFCSFSGGVDGKSIEESLNDLCEQLPSSCAKVQEEKFYRNVNEILSEKDFYKFSYKDKNREYKFFIPKGTIVKENKNTYIKNETFYLAFDDEQNLSFPVELVKKGESFELDTYNLELILDLDNVKDFKDKVLEFRKRLLDRNKNFIKTREDIEYNGIKSTNTLEYIEEQMCPFVPNDSRIEETLKYPLYEFVFSDENKVYSFFIPIFTRITTDKNSKDIFLLISEDRCVDIFAEIAKLEKQPNSKFKLNTNELELLLKSRGVENYKNKVLKFRKQFLEKNKNLIK